MPEFLVLLSSQLCNARLWQHQVRDLADVALLAALPSKRISVGVLDLRDTTPETPELVAERIRVAFQHLPPERITVAPDCGMKYLPRDVAHRKLDSMVAGRNLVRRELGLE